jgi:aminoglycoside phosphotransferase (APT) family kinase protein
MHGHQDHAEYARIVAEIEPTAELRRVWPLQGGISSRMTVLEYAGADGETQRAVLRVREDAQPDVAAAAANEFTLLQRLHAVGLPVPAALRLGAFGPGSLLIGYIDGAPDLAPSQPAVAMARLASQLLQIHRVDRVAAGVDLLPPYTPRFIHQRASHYPDASLGAAGIRDALAAAWSGESKNGPVLLHGDYWPGNVLWRGGAIVAVVDWEEACIGDPLADLAIARLDILWAHGLDCMVEFTHQYMAASPGTDFGDLPYWDLDAALRPAFNIAEWASVDADRSGAAEANMRAGHRLFVERAFAALGA